MWKVFIVSVGEMYHGTHVVTVHDSFEKAESAILAMMPKLTLVSQTSDHYYFRNEAEMLHGCIEIFEVL